MLAFYNNYDSFLAISGIFRIFAPMEAKNEKKYESERELVDGLLAGEESAQAVFYTRYKGLFIYCVRQVLDDIPLKGDYEKDLVNDFFLDLIEKKWLCRFRGNREGSLAYYLAKRAKGYFIRYKTRYQNLLFVEYKENAHQESSSSLLHDDEDDIITIEANDSCDDGMVESVKHEEAWNYIERIMGYMHNPRYAEVLRVYYANKCDDEKSRLELNMKRANWDVLKGRAIKQLKITHRKNNKLWQNIISQMS